MAVDRTVGAQYADRIITLYAEIERQLAEVIAKGVKRNVERDDLSQKLLALAEIRRTAERAMEKIDGKVGPAVRQALHDAAVAGGRKAQEDLLRIRDKRAVDRRVATLDRNLVNAPSILRLAAALSPGLERRLRATHLQVARSAGDIYQHAVAAMAAPGVLAGVTTRREASQKALDHLWQKGITGFVDSAGRNWNLASYVEMATRTTTAQAAVQSHLDELGQSGINLVIVSADGAPCPLCRPWEGKVLTTGDMAGHQDVSRPNELDDSATAVHISGSVSEAMGAGLLHPSCRHTLDAFLPGLTTPAPRAGEGADVYEAEQKQRGLERQARRIAVAQAGAVDPAAAKQLAAEYRAKRAEIAQHVKDNPGLRRKTERERVDLGHVPGAALPPPAKVEPKVVPKVTPKVEPKVEPKVVEPPKPPKPPKPAVVPSVKRPTFEQPVLSENDLRGVYGPRLVIKRGGKDPARLQTQLDGLGQIDRGLHERMNEFFKGAPDGGIYLGPGGVLDTAPDELKHNFRGSPRGYAPGSTWNECRACYAPSSRALLIGDDAHALEGTHSTSQHEFGHALDHMKGGISLGKEFRDIYDSLSSIMMFKPYFSETGNPSGYYSESFAELFNAYSATRGKSEVTTIRAMITLLGSSTHQSDIAYAAIKGPTEEALLHPRVAGALTGMRKLMAMFDRIIEESQ